MTKPAGMQADGSETRRPIRFVTASALFDGHDASINLIRRLLQAAGAEVIHLGHNRSAEEIVSAAIQEDAAAIAVSSYQGGHVEFLRYMADLLREREAAHIRIFAGGGGAITPEEAEQSATYGVSKIFTPEDGRTLGLEGMIAWMLRESDYEMAIDAARELERLRECQPSALGRLITAAEADGAAAWLADIREQLPLGVPVIGITGTGGAGKSSLTDELVRRFLREKAAGTIAVISVDPTRQKTGGALLGDRIRMNAIGGGRTYMRSMATRASGKELSAATSDAVALAKHAGFDWIIVETSGIGQGDSAITRLCDIAMYVMTSEYGAPSQLEKIDMLDYADMIVVNKFDRAGSEDALRDVRKQYRRSRGMGTDIADEELPVYGTIASRFGDSATDALFRDIAEAAERYVRNALKPASRSPLIPEPQSPADDARIAPKWPKVSLPGSIIPRERSGYLGEIVETLRERRTFVEEQAELARRIGKLRGARMLVKANGGSSLLREAESGQSAQGTGSQARDSSQAPPIAAQLPDTAISRPAAEQGGAMPALAAQSPDTVESQSAEHEAYGSPAGQSNLAQADTEQMAVLLEAMAAELELQLHPSCKKLLDEWPAVREAYGVGATPAAARKPPDAGPATANPSSLGATAAKPPLASLQWTTLSGLTLPRIALPRYSCPGDLLRWLLTENVPGQPPYTAGVFPLKRSDEEPKRQFAGEGTPERTNRRFHYLSRHDNAKRLSVAFDSVTLYGHDPGERPDIYGKIGNSGVNVPTLDDMERLFRGFDLCHPATSVSMTINGPAPILLAMYMNTAIRQQLAKFAAQHGRKPDAAEEETIRTRTLQIVRGTVQADILKEDQGQNTCIFSTGFALKMMGDIQQYFIDHGVRHYYSVSISGYHIAEAGANPISQLAFTLANGFTYVEYYRSRGMAVDDFAPNLSFFFSNGLDPEYAVLGRVARRIWSTVIRHKYGGNERSQKLKYHIQTSGRSLHAQEMDFNDIRTTLQALLAIYDNCNSLHTNAYDEAITTPTEHSVRRAMAIQLIINKEFGLARNDNPLQGSFLVEELTDLVEEAVLAELGRIHHRGGVLGAMDTGYQRGRIQEESMLYESLKHSGELPIVGVNTFLNTNPAAALASDPELARSTTEEKETQLANLRTFREKHEAAAKEALERLKQAALGGGNVFEELMETVQVATLGQITTALFEVGGQYRRNM
ncbi:methylmalonyl-CoA mutase [Paenibacillus sp. MY03]|uniref:methylmalonyl-CoA mutase family protein n=1 Tax=Paenibacillus sp. MY03 TaxID=302980 RepID=UPI000B569BCB|nr:methylmalonyl-CoA mutase family protein [Paenibacillus sp. MY03]OUS78461.1 methylmalonyl-CoA mutase [Paenibacillus sp. MY03]